MSRHTMQAAILYGRQDVRVETVPIPAPGPGEVLIKVAAALTCGTDVKVFRRGAHARMIRPPARFGHEFAGVIAAAGPGVTAWRAGMRVVAANSAPCRRCPPCRRGQPNLCRDLLFVNGAYADYLVLPARVVQENLLELPPTMPCRTAALTEPLACVVRGVEAVQPARQETVAILGAGPVGLMFVQLVTHAGARVVLIGKGAQRLAGGRSCGAASVLDLNATPDPVEAARAALPAEGADAVVEAVGRPEAWTQALALVRPGGRVVVFGGCPAGTTVPLDTHRLHYDELTVRGVFHHTPEAIRAALMLLADGVVRPDLLITEEAPLARLPEILCRMATAHDGVKTAILPEGSAGA